MEDQVLDFDNENVNYENRAASKGLRFGNMMADGIIIGIPITFLANYAVYGEWTLQSDIMRHPDLYFASLGLNYLFLTTYFIFSEHFFGKSVGKMMTGTRVVNHLGQKPTLGQIIGRSFARLIPFEAFSFLGAKGIGWHDSLTKTYVIAD